MFFNELVICTDVNIMILWLYKITHMKFLGINLPHCNKISYCISEASGTETGFRAQ